MYVKCVILEGFKSYGSRVTVGEFDPHFNAITGLNGSGKSNILDGIAFVLGITCINVVRAQSLSDLIFKGGSVKRASVSVVFDNKDKRRFKCPIGYERYDEIVVSRTVEEGSTCKYYINSMTSTKKTIQDMFDSVQLSVNNPNFMIMQGKITKVVNMKPKEILHMIEDCVGGTVYEQKRNRSIADMESKQHRINEISDTLANVVYPNMRRHTAAFALYQEFKDIERSRHKTAQVYAIAAYGHHLRTIEETEQQIGDFQEKDNEEEAKIEESNQQIVDKQRRREEIKKESHKIATEKVAGVDKQVKEERKKVAMQEVGVEAAVFAVNQGELSVKNAKKALASEEKQVADYHTKSGNLINEFTAITDEIENAKVNVATCKERESELNAGKVLDEDGKTFDLRERLVVVDDEIGKIRPQHDHEGRFLEVEEKKLREMEVQLTKTPSDAQIEKDFRAAEQEVDKLQRQMQSLNITPEQYATTDNNHNTTSQRLNSLEAERRQMLNDPPYSNFNHNSVHGAVYELFEASDLGNYRNAFEVAIQGALSVIVVDTDDTSRAIIKHGNVATRRSYMPLSKVRRNDRPPPTQAELDRKVGGPGKAVSALSLIKYEDRYDLLMKSYLGRTVLCDTMETAKRVAYQMGYKAITIDGDVCDSDGGMQGGTRKNLGRLITVSQKLRLVNMERNELIRNMRNLRSRMELYKTNAPLLRRYDQAARHLKNTVEERQCTAYAAILADVNALKNTIKDRKTKMEAWKKELAHWTKEQTRLRKTLDSFEEVKTKNLKTARAEIVKWTKALESAQKKYDAKKASFGSVEMDLKAKEALLNELKKDIEKEEKGLEDGKIALAEKQTLLAEAMSLLQEKEIERNEVVEEHRVWDEETSKLDSEISGIQKQIQKLELAKIKRDNTLKKAEEELESTKMTMDSLAKKHPELKLKTHWHELEKPKQSMKKCREDLDILEKRYEQLSQRVDPNVVERLQETKELEKNATNKIEVVKENKKDLEKSIKALDGLKAEMVLKAYHQINTEFGKMMNTLLPEATAKLVPVTNEESLSDGVNIHVKLGGVWKESLMELSGGQRSLVALALVLSLCMYEPAPFYILDEIDAALDLNHTQNIGVLIKQRFKDTQFICVSLKDGMYTNANVLFTTQFQDGKSSVLRTARSSESSKNNNTSRYDQVGKQKVRAGNKKV